jgi:predicted GNAT superfamily acetyltransferase
MSEEQTPHAIRPATPADVPALAWLAERFMLAKLHQEATERHGFLVSNLTESAYSRFIDSADHFYVIGSAEQPQAFILAYGSERIDPAARVEQATLAHHPQPFVMIKQICVAPEASGRGYGRRLYDWVRDRSGGRAQCAAMVLEPYNAPSVRFHERLGFRKAFQMMAPDGMPRGVWVRPAQENDREPAPP